MAEADGGCEVCARDLFTKFVASFPEYRDLGERLFYEIFGSELYIREGSTEGGHRHHPGPIVMYNFSEELAPMR